MEVGSTPKPPSTVFLVLFRVVKTSAILIGLVLSILSLMAVVGRLTHHLVAQFIVAAILVFLVPVPLVRWVFGKNLARARGLMSDSLAVVWLGFAAAFIGWGGGFTEPILRGEATRFGQSGDHALEKLGDLTRWMIAAPDERPLGPDGELPKPRAASPRSSSGAATATTAATRTGG
jgi:hypothetical protein